MRRGLAYIGLVYLISWSWWTPLNFARAKVVLAGLATAPIKTSHLGPAAR